MHEHEDVLSGGSQAPTNHLGRLAMAVFSLADRKRQPNQASSWISRQACSICLDSVAGDPTASRKVNASLTRV